MTLVDPATRRFAGPRSSSGRASTGGRVLWLTTVLVAMPFLLGYGAHTRLGGMLGVGIGYAGFAFGAMLGVLLLRAGERLADGMANRRARR